MKSLTSEVLAPLDQVMIATMAEARPRVSTLGADSLRVVADRARSLGLRWIWVEGFPAAGKTTFARDLADALGWTHVELDEMAIQSEAIRYVDHIDRRRTG